MAAEEDVRLEVEAVQAVYGADCIVIRDFPPHVAVHIRPRTAEDWSQQVNPPSSSRAVIPQIFIRGTNAVFLLPNSLRWVNALSGFGNGYRRRKNPKQLRQPQLLILKAKEGPSGLDKGEDDELLLSESEKNRRQHFEALLKLQQDNNGLIEPRKDLAIQPGMFLPEPVNPPAISSATSSESVIPPTTSAGTGENDAEQAVSRHASEETDASNSTNKTTMSNNRKNTNVRRKARTHTPRVQQHGQSTRKQWIRKEPNTSHQ
ncbi:RWD [Musa troglodytarum]|uniref:RWD n=1 Tax=Musa troglodytarum TaxID=320322 RepID=A0A9E7JRF5_9LILI|nr:RWD [Musa troglodytarum]